MDGPRLRKSCTSTSRNTGGERRSNICAIESSARLSRQSVIVWRLARLDIESQHGPIIDCVIPGYCYPVSSRLRTPVYPTNSEGEPLIVADVMTQSRQYKELIFGLILVVVIIGLLTT